MSDPNAKARKHVILKPRKAQSSGVAIPVWQIDAVIALVKLQQISFASPALFVKFSQLPELRCVFNIRNYIRTLKKSQYFLHECRGFCTNVVLLLLTHTVSAVIIICIKTFTAQFGYRGDKRYGKENADIQELNNSIPAPDRDNGLSSVTSERLYETLSPRKTV